MNAFLSRLLPPSARMLPAQRLPEAVLKAAVFGIVTGPGLGLFFGWLFQRPWQPLLEHPAGWLLHAMFIGVTFSVAFYLFCAIPVAFVARRLGSAPPRQAKIVIGLAGFVGGTLACGIGLSAVPGVTMGPTFIRLTILDGILAMVLALTVAAWDRIRVEKELAVARAQATALQARMNPHFFFNTLNTISALIASNPHAAQSTLGRLADLSRYAFTSTETEFVPLSRELDFARAYLDIEQLRFGTRLRAELPDQSIVADIHVPALTVQPLIENAVRHGIARRLEGGALFVRVRRDGGWFWLTIENDSEAGIGDAAPSFFRPGHALANIRERLRLAYARAASIEVSFPRRDSVLVTIHAPLQP